MRCSLCHGNTIARSGGYGPMARQMLQKLLIGQVECAPKRDGEGDCYELSAEFAYGAVFSGVLRAPMAVVAVRGIEPRFDG